MAHTYDLLVVGDANPDLILHGGDVVPAFGQAEHLVERTHMAIGGSGAIVACGASRLGLRVAMCAVVGDDLFGRFICEGLAAAGVDTVGVVVDEAIPTGITVVLSGPLDRAILTAPGTIPTLRAGMVDRALLERARHVHVSSYYLQTGLAPALPELFDRAHGNGSTTSIDPNWDPAEAWDGGLTELLHTTDIFMPNATEATSIAHTSDLDEAMRSLGGHANLVVAKDGDRGAIACYQGLLHRAAGVRTDAVDTTGAGDSFDAGLLAAWLAGEPIDRVLAIANACGALSTRAIGGTDAQATMEEALALMGEIGAARGSAFDPST